MRRIFRFSVVIVIAVLCVLSLTQNAFADTELYYDDGVAETGSSSFQGSVLGVKFSLDSGWSSAKLLKARYYIWMSPNTFRVNVYDNTGVTQLMAPLDVTPSSTGWFDVDLSSYNIVVSGDFYVAMEFGVSNTYLGHDTSSPDGRSYYKDSTGNVFYQHVTALDLMIRAVVDPTLAPSPPSGPSGYVGGEVFSANKLAVLSPYLALIGLVGVISTVVAVKRRRA